MPTAIDKLQPNSEDAQKKAALSDCIAQEIRNGYPQEQAVAMCNQMLKERTGG